MEAGLMNNSCQRADADLSTEDDVEAAFFEVSTTTHLSLQ
jgi:hypothetical protein